MNALAEMDLEQDLSELLESTRVGEAILALFAERARLYRTLSHMVRLSHEGGWISLTAIDAFILKADHQLKFGALWSDQQKEAVRILQEEFGVEGQSAAQSITFAADQPSWINLDSLAIAAGLVCSEPGRVLKRHFDIQFENEELAIAAEAYANSLESLLEVDGLDDLLVVGTGEGYWHVATRLLSAGGENPSKQDILTLTMKLEAANAQRGLSGGARTLRVGESLQLDDEIAKDQPFRRALRKMQGLKRTEIDSNAVEIDGSESEALEELTRFREG